MLYVYGNSVPTICKYRILRLIYNNDVGLLRPTFTYTYIHTFIKYIFSDVQKKTLMYILKMYNRQCCMKNGKSPGEDGIQ